MKKALVAALAASSLVACTSVESTTVASSEVVASGGEAIAVVQGTSIGFSAIFYLIDIVQSDLDTAVNKLLVSEAKAMGGRKIDLKTAWTTPRSNIFALTGLIIGFPLAQASAVVVK